MKHRSYKTKVFIQFLIVTVYMTTLFPINATEKNIVNKAKEINSDYKKIGAQIQRLMNEPNLTSTASIRNSSTIKTKDDSKVQVYLKVKSTNKIDLSTLEKTGLEIEITNSKLKKIQGWVSTNNINQLAELDNVIHISTPSYGHKRVGSRTTQGDTILRTNLVRAQGFTGEGVKVGIISDGSAGLAAAQASGDLPNNVVRFNSCIIGNISPDCAEGTAMAEIIHDIAPDAELAIADALTTTLEFIQRLDQLANDFEADIIVDDLGFFLEPYFEDGDIADAVNSLPDNIIYISAAGNSATEHYQNSFNPDNTTVLGGQTTVHNFGSSSESPFGESLPITVTPNGGDHCIILQWNDEFTNGFDGPGAVNDYDLLVFSNGIAFFGSLLESFSASSFNTVEIACLPDPETTTTYFVVIDQFSGNSNSEIELFFTGNITIDNQFQVAEDSIFGHPASERAIAVGTINAQDPLRDDIASFSSQGPSRIDFPIRQDRQKPEITGIDGVAVTGSGGFPRQFFGTSAAAPHIAGIAALLKSANPDASREEIETALIDGAIDFGAPGVDNVFGSGRANAENSLTLLPIVESTSSFDIFDYLPVILDAAKKQN